ncbi:unannotated protein [freshwater metagenome]|uniref:Unannotated protein n=1 Tax=freshwater metagenome TaxID=449393 RepID=A0A6J5YHT0_9ZZZZ
MCKVAVIRFTNDATNITVILGKYITVVGSIRHAIVFAVTNDSTDFVFTTGHVTSDGNVTGIGLIRVADNSANFPLT